MTGRKDITRRRCLELMGAGTLAMAAPAFFGPASAMAADAVPSLKAAAAVKGITYGSTLMTPAINDFNPAFMNLFAQQSALCMPELSWKWVEGQYNWGDRKPGIDFCTRHGIPLTGVHLAWHETLPDWFMQITDRTKAEKAIRDHAAWMGKTFGPLMHSWNPVNEALNYWDRQPDCLRVSPLSKLFGRDYFRIAFDAAQQVMPHALRLYNDYGFENSDTESDAKRAALLNLIDWMIKNRIPIDAVGLQSHLDVGNFTLNEKVYRGFLKEIASRGLKIFITELDVVDVTAPADIKARDQKVADTYKSFLNVALDEQAVKVLVVFGISDKYTWILGKLESRFQRPDGLANRPLLFDESLNPKPSFYAVLNALQHAPVRAKL